MIQKGISSRAAGKLSNKKLFNKGSELQNEEFTDGSGLEWYDVEARTYDPQVGRFMQVDPDADDDQEDMTSYHYAFNNPIRYNDPTGEQGEEAVGAAVAGALTVIAAAPEIIVGGLIIGTGYVLGKVAVAIRDYDGTGPAVPSLSNYSIPWNPYDAPWEYAKRHPSIPNVVQAQKKGPKDLMAEAKAQQQKEAEAKARAAQRQAATAKGKVKTGQSNQEVRGDHNTNGGNKNKHKKANARRAREQAAADAKKKAPTPPSTPSTPPTPAPVPAKTN